MTRLDGNAGGLLVAAALAVSLSASGSASAGAWTQPPGRGQIIVSASTGVSPAGALTGNIDAPQSNFLSVFGEYGLIEGLTLGGTAFLEEPDASDGNSTASIGMLVRKRIWQTDRGDVAAVQVGAVYPIDSYIGPGYGGEDADPTQEVSFRGLYGRSFWGEWGNAFLSTEAGYHYQLDGDDDEVRADLTVGYSGNPCCLWLLSSFVTWPVGSTDDRAVKLAPSFAYTLQPPDAAEEAQEVEGRGFSLRPITLQISLTQDVLDFDDGVGVQLSIWKSF